MQMAVIIDLILAAVLIICTVLGWRRGAFKSVVGMVIVVAALLGAGFIASQGAPAAAKAIAPMISQQIEARFDQAAGDLTPAETENIGEEDAAGLFSAAGLYQKTAEDLAQSAVDQAKETGVSLVEAAAESMLQPVAAAVLFLLSFFVLLVVLKLISKVLGLLTAVPGLHLMDALGGGLFGLLQGCIILFALVWAVQFWSGIPAQVLDQTILFRFFATLNPIAMVSGL